MRHRFLRPALISCLVTLVPAVAFAVWLPDGTPQSPSNTQFQARYLQGLAPDASGGAFSVWFSDEPLPDFSGSQQAVVGQRVDILGNRPAPWPAAGVPIRSWLNNTSFGTYALETINVFEDGAGGAFVAAIDHAFIVEYVNLLRAYRVSPGGTAAAVPLTPAGSVIDAAMVPDGAGGLLAIALGQTFAQPVNPPPPNPLYVQRYDSNGNGLWPGGASGYGIDLAPAGQAALGVAAARDAYGGGYFAWIDRRDAGDPDLYLQHITLIGTMQFAWPAGGLLVCGAAGDQSKPQLIPDGVGGVFVVWTDERSGTGRLFMQHVDPDGVMNGPVDGEQVPSDGPGDTFVIAANDSANGLLLALETVNAGVGESRLYRFDGNLQGHAGWPSDGILLNSLSPGDGRIGLLPDGFGGAYVSYRNGFGSAAPQGLYAKHFAPNGSTAPGWSPDGFRLAGGGQNSAIVGSGPGGAIVAWTDSRFGASGIYAQRLALDGPVATDLALTESSVDAGGVSLRWFGAGAEGMAAAIERRTEDSGWQRLASLSIDGTGSLRYRDEQVVAGTRYGYRLQLQEGGSLHPTGEGWVEVPALAMAIASRQNPVSGTAHVALTLPRGGDARLEMIDLAGRRIAHRDLSGLGAGRHVVPIEETTRIAPGIYTLRLTQGGEVRLTRLAVVR